MKSQSLNLTRVDMAKVVAFLHSDGGDGWTIWKPSKFTDMGFRKQDLPVRTYKSDTRDPKSTIFGNDGKVLKKLEGVYGLTFLYCLAGALGVNAENGLMGRGFQAQYVTGKLLEKLEPQPQQ
jgi:hypothetical protein